MFHRTRKHALGTLGAFASVGILRFPAGAAEFTYKYGNDNPPSHPMTPAAQWWADKVKQDSGGQMEIQVFPSSQLGSDPAMLAQLRVGAIEFLHFGSGVLSSIVPVASIDSVGFAFRNYREVFGAMDGDLGALIRAEVLKAGIFMFDKIYDNGFRQITNSVKPIVTPDDLKGMKLRVPISKLAISMFQSLGASPSTLSVAEVYQALQTHLVDGQENPLVVIEANRFYEVQKYCSMTNHVWSGFYAIGNLDAWNRLPKKLQDIVARAYDASADRERAQVRADNEAFRTKLATQGLVFNTPDTTAFQRVLRTGGFYSQWKETFGDHAWSLLEKYTGKLA